jgi:molecular chaperone GrpE
MGNKTDTDDNVDQPPGEIAEEPVSINSDDVLNVTNNSMTAYVQSENPAQENTNNDPAGQSLDPLTTVIEERDALKDQLLRALAETENMRRRNDREADNARRYGHTQFARDLVGAIDNLARALASAPEDKSSLDESVQSLLTGIELSWIEIQSAIEKHGVRQINPAGEKFDYNFHQAMFEVPTNDQPPGMVLEVVQHGYALHDRLLRPAMVGVSKATDTADPAPEEKK